MIRYIHICDKCKKEVEHNGSGKPDEWRNIQIRTNDYKENVIKVYTICEDCQDKLGILPRKEATKEENTERKKSIEQMLFDIVTEIVRENM